MKQAKINPQIQNDTPQQLTSKELTSTLQANEYLLSVYYLSLPKEKIIEITRSVIVAQHKKIEELELEIELLNKSSASKKPATQRFNLE